MITSLVNRKGSKIVYPNATLASDWDVLEQIHETFQAANLPCHNIKWLKGHQEEAKSFEELPADARTVHLNGSLESFFGTVPIATGDDGYANTPRIQVAQGAIDRTICRNFFFGPCSSINVVDRRQFGEDVFIIIWNFPGDPVAAFQLLLYYNGDIEMRYEVLRNPDAAGLPIVAGMEDGQGFALPARGGGFDEDGSSLTSLVAGRCQRFSAPAATPAPVAPTPAPTTRPTASPTTVPIATDGEGYENVARIQVVQGPLISTGCASGIRFCSAVYFGETESSSIITWQYYGSLLLYAQAELYNDGTVEMRWSDRFGSSGALMISVGIEDGEGLAIPATGIPFQEFGLVRYTSLKNNCRVFSVDGNGGYLFEEP